MIGLHIHCRETADFEESHFRAYPSLSRKLMNKNLLNCGAVLTRDVNVIAALFVAGTQDRGREHTLELELEKSRLTFSSPVNSAHLGQPFPIPKAPQDCDDKAVLGAEFVSVGCESRPKPRDSTNRFRD